MVAPAIETSTPSAPTPDAPGQVRYSATAEIVCAERAAETHRPAAKRLIDDPYAHLFLTKPVYKALVATRPTAWLTRTVFDRLYAGYLGIVLLRNKHAEDALAEAIADGVDQVVLLGAGYDTIALRRDLGGATVFEVDAPPTQAIKRAVIERHGLTHRGTVRYVPCDFEHDSLPDRLRSSGFDPSRPSLFLWLGVTFFLTEAAVRQTVADVAELTAPGSRFVFDYVVQSVVDGTTSFGGARRAVAAVVRRGEPYRFGLTRNGAHDFVEQGGFTVESNLSITELATRYAPFPYSTDDFFGVVTARAR